MLVSADDTTPAGDLTISDGVNHYLKFSVCGETKGTGGQSPNFYWGKQSIKCSTKSDSVPVSLSSDPGLTRVVQSMAIYVAYGVGVNGQDFLLIAGRDFNMEMFVNCIDQGAR
jgi:hypothetical protein